LQQVPFDRHTCRAGSGHAPALPHVSIPPHPSEIVPQLLPCAAHVVFVQQVWFDAQTCVVGSQLPQFKAGCPHPAGAVPHTQPAGHIVFGTQVPHTLAVPPPPHVCPVAGSHVPQCSIPPHPSLKSPQLPAAHTFGMQHFSW
jgi:hypothetical protein